jgi:hypothetical protein
MVSFMLQPLYPMTVALDGRLGWPQIVLGFGVRRKIPGSGTWFAVMGCPANSFLFQ